MPFSLRTVTWYSMLAAVVLYVGTFTLAFCLGFWLGAAKFQVISPSSPAAPSSAPLSEKIISAKFSCDNGKTIRAIFFGTNAELTLSDGRSMLLTKAISASGARYANSDESFVFWNKGDTAFIQEGNQTSYQNCGAVK